MNPEQLEKEQELIAFKEEIQKLISETKEKAEKGDQNYNPHFQRMSSSASLTEEDMEWWKIVNKEYTRQDFQNDKEVYLKWLDKLLKKIHDEYHPPSEEIDRYLFAQEIRNRFSGLQLLEDIFEKR